MQTEERTSTQSVLKSTKSFLKYQVKRFSHTQKITKLKRDLNEIALLPDLGLLKTIQAAVEYTEKLRYKKAPYGRYRYTYSGNKPILYASVFAALLRHLLDDLQSIDEEQRLEWIDYINSHQCEDGLFRDPLVENEIAESEDWWGWRHLTLLTLMALTALDGKPKYHLHFLEKLDSKSKINQFLSQLDWQRGVSYTSNSLQNYVGGMQYARDFLNEASLSPLIQEILYGITERCSSVTGLWGSSYDTSEQALSEGIQAGYHFWLLYWYESFKIPFQNKVSSSIFKLQNSYGGFNLENDFSSACEDIDALHPLVYLKQNSTFKDKEEGEFVEFVRRSAIWTISNFNHDGGAVFRRHESFLYGHELMRSRKNESSIFATWFRMLCLAYCFKILARETQLFKFRFLDCPGYQFDIIRYWLH